MAFNDGSARASAGSPQHASLLDQYGANRTPWNVAGVDYHVGVPEGLALRDPATISLAGVTVNASSRSITVTGNNVTLDGYNFSGWSVVTTAANTSLINSNFDGRNPGGTQSSVISGTSTSSNLYVGHSTVDGMAGAGGRAEFLVEMQGPGLTIEHSWLKNSNADLIGRHGTSGGNIVIHNNLLEQAGMGGSGTHGDYLQVYGPTIESTSILFNTAVQNGGITQGFIADNTKAGEFAGNTMIGSVSYWLSVSGPGTDAANLTGPFNTHDNYFDTSKALGFNYPAAGPNDSYSMTAFTHNVNMVTGKVEQDANASSTTWPGQTTPTPTPTPTPTAPSAPTIASFSNDSGVAGDKVTNDSTLTLTGSAAANSTVKVFDGTTQVGTTTANSSGSWTYTSASLSDGSHSLTAKATTTSGTSAASAALGVRIDTKAPTAPTIATPTDNSNGGLNLSGTAEANSTVKVYDGATQIGTATANNSGAWGYTTGTLAAGSHSLTAKATDSAGNTSAASAAVAANTGTTPTPSPTAPAAPKITALSNDSGVAGDRITNDNTLTLTGTAAANGTVKVFDGTTQVGTATANSSGAWSYTTTALADGNHSLTAKVTTASGTSTASSPLAVTVDTTAPTAPKIGSYTSDGSAIAAATASTTAADDLTLNGTAEANTTVKVFDGTSQIGSTTANSSGAWNYTASNLADGNHSFTSKAVDKAGNTSAASTALSVNVDAQDGTQGPTAEFTNAWQKWNDKVVFRGTADPYDQITIYDNGGTKAVGSAKAGTDGTWSLTTSAVSDKVVHTFTATVTDSSGQTGSSSGSAIMGTRGDDRLTSTSGNDLFRGQGGHDTFEFAADFGKDVITDFRAAGRSHDVVQFSKNVFDDVADVLSHASQHGRDVVINAHGDNTLTLKNTSLTSLDRTDFHFV